MARPFDNDHWLNRFNERGMAQFGWVGRAGSAISDSKSFSGGHQGTKLLFKFVMSSYFCAKDFCKEMISIEPFRSLKRSKKSRFEFRRHQTIKVKSTECYFYFSNSMRTFLRQRRVVATIGMVQTARNIATKANCTFCITDDAFTIPRSNSSAASTLDWTK